MNPSEEHRQEPVYTSRLVGTNLVLVPVILVAATIRWPSSRYRLTLISACSTCRAFKPGPFRHRPQVSALWRRLFGVKRCRINGSF